MTISIQKLSAVALVISGASLAACNVDTTGSGATDAATQELTADGNEAVASNVQQASFGELAFSVTKSDPALAADEALAPTTKMFSGGCATRTKDPTNPKVVHIHFTDCTGPFGLRHLNGDETAVFSANADGTLHVALSDDGNLTVNGRSVQHSGAGDITISGATRNVAWKGAWTRENDKGLTVSHTTDKTILVDTTTGCRN
jgi:hypothetical protein